MNGKQYFFQATLTLKSLREVWDFINPNSILRKKKLLSFARRQILVYYQNKGFIYKLFLLECVIFSEPSFIKFSFSPKSVLILYSGTADFSIVPLFIFGIS